MKELYSILYQFVQEKQRSLQRDFEYKREILVLDTTDHQLLQRFFDVEPNKSQIVSARRIWQATKKQMLIDEDISLLEYRLTSTQTYSPSNLIDCMLDDIDLTLKNPSAVVPISENDRCLQNDIERLRLLKNDTIHQAIITSRKIANDLNTNIQTEQKYFQ